MLLACWSFRFGGHPPISHIAHPTRNIQRLRSASLLLVVAHARAPRPRACDGLRRNIALPTLAKVDGRVVHRPLAE
eukprot:3152964-Prymnesium_polylepis.1